MDKRIKKPLGHFFMFTIIVLLIVVIFLTVGWAARKLLDEDKPLTLEDKKKRLKWIETKIMQLHGKKEEIKAKERFIFLVSRLLVAMMLVLTNYIYMKYYKIPFDVKKSLSELLRVNSMILLAYSFVAFITYGTPARFVDSLKLLVTSLLQKFSIETYSHYEKLLVERNALMTEIDIEEKQLRQKQATKYSSVPLPHGAS